jgi:hypothetical protein
MTVVLNHFKNLEQNSDRNLQQNLRNSEQFIIPASKTNLFEKSSLYSLPKVWNELYETKLQSNKITKNFSP